MSPLPSVSVEAKDLTKVFGLRRFGTSLSPERPSDPREAQRYQVDRPGDFVAVDSVSFNISRGERVGFIGHNGSGKSTLFQMLSGILRPTGGSLAVNGSVGTLLEPGSGFHPEFTGRENLRMAAEVMGLPRAELEPALAEAADFAELDLFLDRPLRTYSQGMLLRLAFSLNVMVRPDILLIDEALAVGDLRFQQKCFDLLRSGRAAETLLLISHDLSALSTLVDRVIVMDHGRLIFDGPVKAATAAYLRALHGRGRAGSVAPTGAGLVPSAYSTEAEIPWITLAPDQLSGSGKIDLRRLALVDETGQFPAVVQAGDPLTLELDLEVPEANLPLIFGYIVHDRLGQNLCGQNSFDKTGSPLTIPVPGGYRVSLSFNWPSVKPGPYTVTVGIGEGYHSETHEILSWAHHVFQVECCCFDAVVTTVFSNPLQRVALRPRA
jgi:ABC-type polysaccharide/polyol phosphate transport system ATPase subunit